MPKPEISTYPKHQRWRFIQRSISDEDLILFSKAIMRSHGQARDDCLVDLLDFMNPDSTEHERLKYLWLGLAVNIMHQMGLGYTWAKGTKINVTDIGSFVASTENSRAFYYYWALKFQFPFGFPKQLHYIDNNVAVQPIVLILEHLCELYNQSNEITSTYLSKFEIAYYLMRATNHENIVTNCQQIFERRTAGFDYTEEEATHPGFVKTANHLFDRGRLFFSKFDLLIFDGDNIIVTNEEHIEKIARFLDFKSEPVVFTENSQDMRNTFFVDVYNNLNPDPIELVEYVDRIVEMKPAVEMSLEQILEQDEDEVQKQPTKKDDFEYPNPETIESDFIEFNIAKIVETEGQQQEEDEVPTRAPRVIDYETEARRNKKLGNHGELIVYHKERQTLLDLGLTDLADKVKMISKVDDWAGYDILSFDVDGEPRYIEVKSTKSKAKNFSFYISSNECKKARKLENYYIYIVFEAKTESPKIWKIKNPLQFENEGLELIPINYRAIITILE